MTVQLSVTVRNAKLDVMESTIGTSPILKFLSGTMPADCAAAETGTVLATLTLPSDWMAAAASGSKAKAGTWQDPTADGTGVAGYYRIYDSTGTTCHVQGTVTVTGGGGDITVDNTNFATGQNFTITSYSWTEGNA